MDSFDFTSFFAWTFLNFLARYAKPRFCVPDPSLFTRLIYHPCFVLLFQSLFHFIEKGKNFVSFHDIIAFFYLVFSNHNFLTAKLLDKYVHFFSKKIHHFRIWFVLSRKFFQIITFWHGLMDFLISFVLLFFSSRLITFMYRNKYLPFWEKMDKIIDF